MQKKDLFTMLTVGFVRVFVYGKATGGVKENIVLKEEINSRGSTMIELLVAVCIIATLATAIGFSYADWMGKYKVEKATKELYADLMNVRCMAMTKNCDHFVDFNSPAPSAGNGTYRIAEDTNGDDEGDADADGIIDAAGHTILPSFPKTVAYPIANNFTSKIINFDKRGIVQPSGTICFFTDNEPDYDCIVISQTRIIMGKLKKQPSDGGECKAENCAKK